MIRAVPVTEGDDLRDIGLLMTHLMEFETSVDKSQSLELRDPSSWKSEIKSFLKQTDGSSRRELEQV